MATATKTETVTLTLTKDEADFLRGYLTSATHKHLAGVREAIAHALFPF